MVGDQAMGREVVGARRRMDLTTVDADSWPAAILSLSSATMPVRLSLIWACCCLNRFVAMSS